MDPDLGSPVDRLRAARFARLVPASAPLPIVGHETQRMLEQMRAIQAREDAAFRREERVRLMEATLRSLGPTGTLSGICAPYGVAADINGDQVRFEPGAFKNTAPAAEIVLGHLSDCVLGIAYLQPCAEGLWLEAELGDPVAGIAIRCEMRSSDRVGFSVAWLREHEESRRVGGVRAITSIHRLVHVGLTPIPAFPTKAHWTPHRHNGRAA